MSGLSGVSMPRAEHQCAAGQADPRQASLTAEQLQHTPAMLLVLDLQLRVRCASHRWLQHFGWRREQVLNLPLESFFTPAERQRAQQDGLHHLMVCSGCQALDYRMITRDGAERVLALSAAVIPQPDPDHRRIHVVFEDITAREVAETALHREQARLVNILEGTEAGTWEWNVQTDEVRVNARFAQLLGHPPAYFAKLTGEDILALIHPLEREQARALRDRYVAGLEPRYELESRRRHRNGSWVWFLTRGEVRSRLATGEPEWMFGTHLDITPLKSREDSLRVAQHVLQEANQRLHTQKELLRVTLQSIDDGVITTDAGGLVNWLNPMAETLTGWSLAQACGQRLGQVFVTHAAPVAGAANPHGSSAGRGQTDVCVLQARDGRGFGIEVSRAPILGPAGEVLGTVLTFRDVSERQRLSQELQYRAAHDPLTGLLNRSEFESRLQHCLHQPREQGGQHVLLFIDLDQFKLVNDACGLTVGDELLKQVARMLQEGVRASDTLARLGGDEFAVLLEQCSVEQATRVAAEFCEQMEHFRFVQGDQRFRLGASIGLVPVDARWSSLTDIIQAGDACCHAAKDQGRNRVHVWQQSDAALIMRRAETQWASRIAAALDDDRFVLYLQQIEPLQPAGQGLHAEVLLRMLGADGSLISPGSFLPAAERFHLASRIDRWVLEQVLQRFASLPLAAQPDLLCINISGRSVADRNFHAFVLEALRARGADLRQSLCFEITETVAITNLSDAALFIRQVRALGVRIALDDFGAGPSSFAYLKSLPVDLLKIDGQLVQGVVTDALDQVAVRSFVEVARVMGVKTIAESVESLPVLQRLRELGVDAAQGYLLHRPVPLEHWMQGLSAAASP